MDSHPLGVGIHPSPRMDTQHPPPPQPLGYTDLGYYGIQLTSGRYTSYWNAFLFILCRSDTYLMFLNKFHPIESTFIRFCFWSTLCFKQISVDEGRVRKVEDLQTMTSHKPMAPQILKTNQANQLGKNPEMFKKSNMICLL